jgi:hypothetical protein
MRAQGQDREKRRQEQEEKHDRTGFEFALAHLLRDGSYWRLILWRSHEAIVSANRVPSGGAWTYERGDLVTEYFWKADAYTCTIRIWVQRLEES